MNATNLYIATVRNFYGPSSTYTINEEAVTLPEALAKIKSLQHEVYTLAHNEHRRPDYLIIDQTTLDSLAVRHEDQGNYEWDYYDGDLNEDGNPTDEQEAARWMSEQDIDLIREESLSLRFGVSKRRLGASHDDPAILDRETVDEAVEDLIGIVSGYIELDFLDCEEGDDCEALDNALNEAFEKVRLDRSYEDGNGYRWHVVADLEPHLNGRTYSVDVDDLSIGPAH